MKEINLYLVRHGQTEWNLKEQMQGSQDSPLTQQGIEGAQLTGQHLRQIPFMQAYSSPQPRAIDTLNHIIGQFDNTIQTGQHADLKEMDFGLWEGLTTTELKQHPEFHIYLTEPAKYDPSKTGGEGYLPVLKRMQKALDDIITAAPEQNGNILIVSHGTVLRLLLCVLNGGDWHRHRDEAYFPRMLNTSISLVNYQQPKQNEKGHYSVKYYNDISHL